MLQLPDFCIFTIRINSENSSLHPPFLDCLNIVYTALIVAMLCKSGRTERLYLLSVTVTVGSRDLRCSKKRQNDILGFALEIESGGMTKLPI